MSLSLSASVQAAPPLLDHVDEVGQRLLLVDGDRLEVPDQGVRQLRLVQPRPGLHLEVKELYKGEIKASHCVKLWTSPYFLYVGS